MKQITISRLVKFTFILFLFAMQGCKKSTDGGNNSNPDFYLSAKINGQSWSANLASSLNNSPSIAALTTSGSTSVVLLLGLKTGNKDTTAIILIFPQNITLNKTFTMDPNQFTEGAYVAEIAPGSGTYYGYNTTPATGGSGSISITLFDKTAKIIEGTFSGSFGSQQGRAAVQVTEGKFRCVYTTDVNQLPKTGVKI